MLHKLGITLEQLVDLAILVGTDFNEGVQGIGPKTALKLVKANVSLEKLPTDIYEKLPRNFEEVRHLFLHPNVTNEYDLSYRETDEDALNHFLCEARDFSRDKVDLAIQRMRIFRTRENAKLTSWFDSK
jgi:flap endonuclease-1